MKQTKYASNRGLIEGSPNGTMHANVCGRMQTPIIGRKRNFLTLVTARQRFACVNLLKDITVAAKYIYKYTGWIDTNARYKTKKATHR